MFENMLPNLERVLARYSHLFAQGLGYTLLLSFLTVLGGTVIGSLLALMRRSRYAFPRFLSSAYVEVVRGTPLLLQLYFYYFLLPEILPMLNLSKFACIVIALIFNSAGYVAEIVRAGIQAVDPGQNEAARTLGLSPAQAMLKVVLPQAVRNILPALCNEFITLIKETSILAYIALTELTKAGDYIRSKTYSAFTPYIVSGILYLVVTGVLTKLLGKLERRLRQGDNR